MNGIWAVVQGWLYYFGLLPLVAMLPETLARRAARGVSRRQTRTRADSFRHTQRNMQEILGIDGPQACGLSFDLFLHNVLEQVESFRYPFMTSRWVKRHVRVEGLDHLLELRRQGRGALLVTMHMGAICVAAISLGRLGLPVMGLSHDSRVDPTMSGPLQAYSRLKLYWIDRRAGAPTVFVHLKGHSSAKAVGSLEAMQALREGRFVTMPLDIPPQWISNREEVDFLGKRARFATGAIRLAQLIRVPLVPYFILRGEEEWRSHRILIRAPIEPTGCVADDLQACVDQAEPLIRSHPSQWFTWDSLDQFLADPEIRTMPKEKRKPHESTN